MDSLISARSEGIFSMTGVYVKFDAYKASKRSFSPISII